MKRFLRIAQVLAVLVVGSVLSLSCMLDSGGSSGSVQFTIKGAGDTARVYLATTQGVLAPIGGSEDYLEVSLSSGETTVTVEGLPAGAEYNAFFGLGDRDKGWLETDWYAVSAPFEISAGTNVEVDLGLLDATSAFNITYSDQLMNNSLKGVIHDGSNIYTPTSNTLYKGGTVSTMASLVTLSAGYVVNSVSLGSDLAPTGVVGTIWLNTNQGIVPSTTAGGLTTNFSTNLGSVSVLDSGTFFQSSEWYIYYQSAGGLGGVEDTDNPLTYSWIDIDVSDVIQGQPVHNFVIDATNGYGYFATTLGSFRLSQTMIDDGSDDFLNDEYSTFFQVGDNVPVIAIDFENPTFTMGTEDGVWRTSAPTVGSTLVSGTSGRRYHTVASSGGSGNWAARSPLYLVIGSGSTVTMTIPFNVLPDGMTGMAWDGGTLFIAADEGLISITPP